MSAEVVVIHIVDGGDCDEDCDDDDDGSGGDDGSGSGVPSRAVGLVPPCTLVDSCSYV